MSQNKCCGRCDGVNDICIADRMEELYLTSSQIYLVTPIMIKGIEIKHTKVGLEWLIQHYTTMLENNPVNKLTGPARKLDDTQYMMKLIKNWKQHLELYNSL